MTHREVMQQALEALESHPYDDRHWVEECQPAITALKAALAEPTCNDDLQVEPVAKVELMTTGGNAGLATRIVEIDDHLRERLRPGQMLYTLPAPQRQPLTEDEAWDMWEAVADRGKKGVHIVIDFARAIERAHGITGETK